MTPQQENKLREEFNHWALNRMVGKGELPTWEHCATWWLSKLKEALSERDAEIVMMAEGLKSKFEKCGDDCASCNRYNQALSDLITTITKKE